MVITRDFLMSEIRRFQADKAQALEFVKSTDIAIAAYSALVDRLDAPEPEPEPAAPVVDTGVEP